MKNRRIAVKIDTEGYEFEVLAGMKQLMLENRCRVFLEYHETQYLRYFGNNYVKQHIENFKNAGYVFIYAAGENEGQVFEPDTNLKGRTEIIMRRVDGLI